MRSINGLRLMLPLSAAVGGLLLLPGNTASAASDAASETPTATAVTSITEDNKTGWESTDNGRLYYESGRALTGVISVDGITYVLGTDGIQLTGWQLCDGVRHYYDPKTGEAAIGVQEIDGTAYLFDFTGAQKTGWRTVNGLRQYYDPESGEVSDGWVDYGGYHYYTDEKTGKQTGEFTEENIRYLLDDEYGYQHTGFCTFSDKTTSYFHEDGSAVKGWLDDNGKSYYFDNTYRMLTGWQTIDKSKYYFSSNGVRFSGLLTLNGKLYYLDDASGTMQTGWKFVSGKKYYFNSNGCAQIGWQTIDNARYYFDKNGVMQTGLLKISNQTYYFNSNGQMAKGWQTISGKKYYFNGNGIMQTGFLKQEKGTYYFNSSGVMQTGWQTISGKRYYFQENGLMLTNTTKDGYRIGADGTAVKIIYPKASAKLDSIGRDLQKAFNWASSMTYYGHNAYMPDTAEPGTKWYADFGFDNNKGNCYVMAAVFCEMARELGYNAKQISGQVPLRRGGLGPHSWVEITINGTVYVYDPDFTNETGRNGFQITYGQSGTWRYVKGTVMSD